MDTIFQHKRKLTFLLILLLFISAIFISTPPLTVKADGNGTGDDVGEGVHGIIEGPTSAKQFWLMYITDENGAVKSDVVLIENQPMNANRTYLYTRPEHGSIFPSRVYIGCDWGFAFDSNVNGRGTAIKQLMLSPDPTRPGQMRGISVIENYWGQQMAEKYIDNEWYLVLEAGLWCGVYKNQVYQNHVFAGTAYGWALMQHNNNVGDIGDPKINRYTNNALPNGTKLEFAQTGLNKPNGSGKLSNIEIMSAGYGCLIIWANDTPVGDSSTHTWDSTNHPTNEDKAPDPIEENPLTPPADCIYTIIKSYRIKDGAGNYTDRGTYIRESTVYSILIEDEPLGDGKNYKVIGWRPSSQSKPAGLTALNWESTVPEHIRETGTEAGFTDLDSSHKYLYVLLEATEDGVADYNYNLPESSITRRINYSIPDHALGNMTSTLNTYQFAFSIGAHKTSCTGHPWTHSDNDSSCTNYDTINNYGTCNCGGTHTHLTV